MIELNVWEFESNTWCFSFGDGRALDKEVCSKRDGSCYCCLHPPVSIEIRNKMDVTFS